MPYIIKNSLTFKNLMTKTLLSFILPLILKTLLFFPIPFLTQDIYSTLGIFLTDLLNQTPVEESEEESQYPYPYSDITQFETFFRDPNLEQEIKSLREQYPLITVQDHTTLDLEITNLLCTHLFNHIETSADPSATFLLIFSHFLQRYYKNYYIYQTTQPLRKLRFKTTSYTSHLHEAYKEPLLFQACHNTPPLTSYFPPPKYFTLPCRRNNIYAKYPYK